MKQFCSRCLKFTNHIQHCSCCGEQLSIGDEIYKTADKRIYCTCCCGKYELEAPEPFEDEDYLRDRRWECQHND